MEEIIKAFSGLPDTSKSAIIASIITFIGVIFAATAAFVGVYVTHCGHERRFKAQLEHDKSLKRLEREMSLRKEIYLEAAEAIVAGLTAVTRHADLNLPHNELTKEFNEKRSAIAKVHLIGREQTVYAVSAFTDQLSAVLLQLSLQRQPLLQMLARQKALADQIAAHGKEKDRIIEIMKQLNFDGNTEQHRWDFVRKGFEFEDTRMQEALAEQQALAPKLRSDHLRFLQTCSDQSSEITKLLIPAVKEVRTELDLPFDEEKYSKMMEESRNQQTQMIRKFIAELSG